MVLVQPQHGGLESVFGQVVELEPALQEAVDRRTEERPEQIERLLVAAEAILLPEPLRLIGRQFARGAQQCF